MGATIPSHGSNNSKSWEQDSNPVTNKPHTGKPRTAPQHSPTLSCTAIACISNPCPHHASTPGSRTARASSSSEYILVTCCVGQTPVPGPRFPGRIRACKCGV
eukprot:18103-Chlamydomonas_euryale.AAC.1